MSRHFNIAGPCNPGIHYMLPPLARISKVMALIEQQAYLGSRQQARSTSKRNPSLSTISLWKM